MKTKITLMMPWGRNKMKHKELYNYQVQSEFIKKLIKGQSFNNHPARKRVDDLILLEIYVLTKRVQNVIHGWVISALIDRRRTDYERLLQELDPKGYEEYIESFNVKEEYEKKLKAKADVLLKKERQWWIKNGGRE